MASLDVAFPSGRSSQTQSRRKDWIRGISLAGHYIFIIGYSEDLYVINKTGKKTETKVK